MYDAFIVKQIIKKRQEFNLESDLIFIDNEKVFDRVDRKILRCLMHKIGVSLHLAQACQSLCQNTNILIDG